MHPAPLPWRPVRDRLANLAARTFFRRAVAAQNPRAIVSFTFDDIDATAATTGASILERHGARGTFYVAGSLCEMSGTAGPYASAETCRGLAQRGHELGCHTYGHVALRRLSPQALAEDVARNSEYLLGATSGATLQSFAFPYNAPTLRGKRLLSQRFTTCRGGVAAINSGTIDLAFLKAIEINDVDFTVSDARRWIKAAMADKGWLIFLTHDVKENPSRHGCTPELLEATVALAAASGAEVLPVREGAARVSAGEPSRQMR